MSNVFGIRNPESKADTIIIFKEFKSYSVSNKME